MGGRDYICTRDTRCGGQSMRAFLLKLMNLCVLIFLFYYILVNCTLFFCLYFFCDVKGD